MSVWGTLVSVLNDLEPPDGSGTRWRWSMFVGFCALTLGFVVHVAWACGYIPFASGFARMDDVEALNYRVSAVEMKMNAVLELGLKQDMRAVQREICHSDSDADRMERNTELDQLQIQYAQASGGREWVVPPCGDL